MSDTSTPAPTPVLRPAAPAMGPGAGPEPALDLRLREPDPEPTPAGPVVAPPPAPPATLRLTDATVLLPVLADTDPPEDVPDTEADTKHATRPAAPTPAPAPPPARADHVEVTTTGEPHQIPNDGAPHAPTTECGCSPQRAWQDDEQGGRWVIVHPDTSTDTSTAAAAAPPVQAGPLEVAGSTGGEPAQLADLLHGLGQAVRTFDRQPAGAVSVSPATHEISVHFGGDVALWSSWADAWLCTPLPAREDLLLGVRVHDAVGQLAGWTVRLTSWARHQDLPAELGALAELVAA